jgi:hypothetical protein
MLMSEENVELITVEMRTAWLEIGGYVAAADGLSDDEASSLAHSAAGPEMDLETCMNAITRGAGYSQLPDSVLEEARKTDYFVQLQCLSEVFGASAVDGVGDPEWTRIREVTGQVLGADRTEKFIRVCQLEIELDEARSALMG